MLNIPAIHGWMTFHRLNRLVSSSVSRNVRSGFTPESNNFLYVAASCLPYHISGYTSRTHEILKALKNQFRNLNLFVLTRTGYPWDRRDSLTFPADDQAFSELDGIRYDHLRTPANNRLTAIYAEQASAEIEKYLIANHISCVHAASNHVNALPALIAAKRLGIRFQYEIRGLWALTRISRMPEFEKSHNFKLGLDLEAFVAAHADRVFVISEQLSLYIQREWNISPEKIFLLPNCASRELASVTAPGGSYLSASDCENHNESMITDNAPVPELQTDLQTYRQAEPVTIGYAGSLIVYEGLQTLIKAVDLLVHQKKFNVHLNIIGDGEYREALENLTVSLELNECVTFFGRLSPEDARRKQEECSLICIPREPFEVCRIVPPIKLAEAMAKGRCVVVPDLPVFIDETRAESPAGVCGQDLRSTKSEVGGDKNPGSENHGSFENYADGVPSLEMLSNNGSGCIFFHSGNEMSLADVLGRYLRHPYDLRDRGILARQYVLKHRQWNMFTGQMIAPAVNRNKDE